MSSQGPSAPIPHVFEDTQRASNEKKQSSAIKHFQFFLTNHYQGTDGVVNPPLTAQDLKIEHITNDVVGTFCTYLSKEARCECKPPPSPRLAWLTIQGYFSAFKSHYIRKFKCVPESLSNELTSRYSRAMLSNKTEIVVREGSALYSKKEVASEEEIEGFSAICYWNDDVCSSEYNHLVRSCINNCGRGSEIAVLKWLKASTISVRTPGGKAFKTMSLLVNRLKTAGVNPGEDNITHFVHINDFKKDYLFAMFHHIVMMKSIEQKSEYMFPSWNESVVNSRGDVDSNISKQFKDHWQRITVIGCDYMTQSQRSDGDASHCNVEHIEILKDLGIDVMASLQWKPGAHDPKNYSINKLGNSNLAPQHIVPRAGKCVINQ